MEVDPDKRNAAWYAVFGAVFAETRTYLENRLEAAVYMADKAMLELEEYDKNKEENPE